MNTQQWIQVGSQTLQDWVKVIIQGRADEDQWVTGFKVSYTTDGKSWKFAEKGKVFEGSFDRSTKVEVDFSHPIQARTIRIHPVEWHGAIAMRFEAVFVEEKVNDNYNNFNILR